MIDFTELLPKVSPSAMGAAEPLMVDHIRDAFNELCKRHIWQAELSASLIHGNRIKIVKHTTTPSGNQLVLPEGAILHSIGSIRFNGRELEPVTTTYLDQRYANWRDPVTYSGMPRMAAQLEVNEIAVFPTETGTLALSARLKPSQLADAMPDDLFEQYAKTIADGALSTLLMLPNQPFTNPELAMMHGQLFKAELDASFAKYVQGQITAPLRVKANFV